MEPLASRRVPYSPPHVRRIGSLAQVTAKSGMNPDNQQTRPKPGRGMG